VTDSKHVINLRGPWKWSEASSSHNKNVSDFQRFRFPDELAALTEGRGSLLRVLLARDFGRPSGLTDQHRVELVIDQLACCKEVVLNDEHLDFRSVEDGLGRCDIGSLIQPRNRLRIICELPQPTTTGSLVLQDVRIEICEHH
jgi:hypothetical protein